MREMSIELAARVREVRLRHYGEDGATTLAGKLGLPARTWGNYESGVTMPAAVMLKFIAATGTSPRWLLDGTGEPGI